MNKKLFAIIVLFSLCFLSPYKTYALDKNSTSEDYLNDVIDKATKDFVFLRHKNSGEYYFYDIIYKPGYSVMIKDNKLYYRNGDWITGLSYLSIDTSYNWYRSSKSNFPMADFEIVYSTVDILNEDDSVYFKKNYTFNKSPGGIVEPDKPSDSTSCEFPFTREEFMTIPYLMSLLICMLFFKWCFPMKGGKKA